MLSVQGVWVQSLVRELDPSSGNWIPSCCNLRIHMPGLKIPHATAKTQRSQIHTYFKQQSKYNFLACPLYLKVSHLRFNQPQMPRFLGWLGGKESACQCRTRRFDPWVGNIRWNRKWQPPPVLLPEKSHRQRSLTGYTRWGCKESDTTKQLSAHCENLQTYRRNTTACDIQVTQLVTESGRDSQIIVFKVEAGREALNSRLYDSLTQKECLNPDRGRRNTEFPIAHWLVHGQQ